MRVYAYDGCSTCAKALKYLRSTGRHFELLPIRTHPPTLAELRTMLKVYGGNVRALFNTSGAAYRSRGLSTALKGLSEEEALRLLAADGNLVKRPFVLAGNTGMVGFRLAEWKDKGIRPLPAA